MKKIFEHIDIALETLFVVVGWGIVFLVLCAIGWVVASVWEFLLGVTLI